jgi:hypothetical protein
MTTTDAMRRIEALEAAKRREDLGPLATELAAQVGVTVDELMAEAERIAVATAGLAMDETYAYMAADAGIPVAELRAEADRLMGQ